ncbi:MAG: hypothetical protein LJE62_09610 [Silicimonas sp.]|jgi:hypothetical protein|nr:hypothetical protein [Silicimonas sp.]
MSEDQGARQTALQLKRLIEAVDLSRNDRFLAERCLRRLEQPLRLTVFGTDTRHALALINLMIGQPVVSPGLTRARIQFLHGETAHARVQHRDGSQERIEGSDFRRLFEGNPSRVRIYVDLPVLKKLSLLVATEEDPKALCEDVDKTLPSADISLWAGGELTQPVEEAWQQVPDRLRDHSYLVLSPGMKMDTWKSIAQEFVEIIRVDPASALSAKCAEGGVDKEAFRESGGTHIVKTIKKEIDVLVQSALDAGEVLCLRYADQLPEVPEAAEDEVSASPEAISEIAEDQPFPDVAEIEPEMDIDDAIDRVLTRPMREQVYSVQLGKLASRSRLLNSPAAHQKVTPRTVSMAIKNMPKNPTRTISKSGPKPRPRSRRTHPSATPWSLGL